MRGEAEPPEIGTRRAGGEASRHAEKTVLVFEASAGFGDQIQKVIVRIVVAAHDLAAGFHDFLYVGSRAIDIEERRVAFEHQIVLLTAHGKFSNHRIADDDRAVDQRVEVFGAKGVRLPCNRHQWCGNALPRGGHVDAYFVRAFCTVGQREKCRGAIEHRERRLHPVVAHSHLAAVHAIADGDVWRARTFHRPTILACLLNGSRPPIGALRNHVFDIALVLPHEIRTRRPDRHEQFGLRPATGRNRRVNLQVVRLRRRKAQRVADRFGAWASIDPVVIARLTRHTRSDKVVRAM